MKMTSLTPEGWPEALTRLRWLRGTYLDQMVTFEGLLDARLFEYLAIPEELRMLTYGAVLTRVTLRGKVEMMCDFIEHFDSSGQWNDLKVRLSEAVDFRNRCAHAHLEPVLETDGTWSASFVRWRKGEIHRIPISDSEFVRQTEEISFLVSELLRFANAVAEERLSTS